MKMRKMAAVSAMTIAALGLAAGTAYADPAPAPAASDELNVAVAPASTTRPIKTAPPRCSPPMPAR